MERWNRPQTGMNRSSSTVIFGLMALLTLVMVVMLPALGGNLAGGGSSASGSAPAEAAIESAQMRAFDNQRSPMVRVEGGTFTRGTTRDEIAQAAAWCEANNRNCDTSQANDALPAHRVQVDTFWMEVNEVTYQQFVAFLNTLGPGRHVDGCDGHLCVVTRQESETASVILSGGEYRATNPALNNYPVVDVTWYGAQAYCESLGRRLPTEAEWEYAARGVSGSIFPWGDEWRLDAANVRGSVQNTDGVIIAGPQAVGARPAYASRDGVRDLAGNVAEWVADWYAPDHYGSDEATRANDTGPAEGTERVIRGGSWNDNLFYARSMQRRSLSPSLTSASVGFRCVADD